MVTAQDEDPDEPEVKKAHPGRSPLQQDSNTPIAWKPTVDEPVPVVRCTVIKRDGVRCGRWSLRGMTKCYSHGSKELNFPNVAARVEAVLESARMRLIDDTDLAVDTLEQLMQPGTAEGIRLKAATEVLDRTGIRGGFEIDVEVEHKEDPAQVIAQRLKQLRERGLASAQNTYGMPQHDDVIEGEVVEDDGDPDQGTLF